MQGAVVRMSAGRAQVAFGPGLPLEALLLGRPVGEAAALLPRLFNLCRAAQENAARMALGLEVTVDAVAEVLRDHRARLSVTLRLALGLDPLPLSASAAIGPLPDSLAALETWLAGACPHTGTARRIAALFPRGAGVVRPLPAPPGPLDAGAFENSPAARQAGHPLLRAVEARDGRGPLWRFLGLLADLTAAGDGRLPPPRMAGSIAVVQAARGAYALRITHRGGLVTGIDRRTPTDHLLAPGGVLEQALGGLDPALARPLVALLDPCVPVAVQAVQDA